ncbi:MAG TPA: hypothetical protein VGZ22_17315 [Isosphaeraceae bacterium]|jgi:hypothetical protein|nr:hypothetical protein [Isosphaeraceae bacterium]
MSSAKQILANQRNAQKSSFHRCLSQLIATHKMEPEYQTISRLQNKGQHPSRVWVGTDWMLWSEYETMMAGKDPHEAEADSRLEGVETVGSKDVGQEGPEAEEATSATFMEPSVITGWHEPDGPQPLGENQPIFGAAKDNGTKTSVDPQHRSRTGPGARHEGVLERPQATATRGFSTSGEKDRLPGGNAVSAGEK